MSEVVQCLTGKTKYCNSQILKFWFTSQSEIRAVSLRGESCCHKAGTPQEHHWLLLPVKADRASVPSGTASQGSPPEFFPLSPTALSCPPPPAIPQGQHSGNSSGHFVFGSVTTYRCEPGLQLVGQDTLRCGDNGTWSGAPPACLGELIPPPGPAACPCWADDCP